MKTLVNSLVALWAFILAFTIPFWYDPAAAQTPARIEYISPQAGSSLVPPKTTIIIRPNERIDRATLDSGWFNVVGTQTEIHQGTVVLADDAQTIIFKPN